MVAIFTRGLATPMGSQRIKKIFEATNREACPSRLNPS